MLRAEAGARSSRARDDATARDGVQANSAAPTEAGDRFRLAMGALVALLPLGLERAGVLPLVGAPRTGLVLLPWLFLAGLPRAGRAGWERAPLLALPTVALAFALDARVTGGAGSAAAGSIALAGLSVMALLALAAARGARVYAAAWAGLVALPAGLATAFALSSGGAQPLAPAWAAILEPTPLVWAARAVAGAEVGALEPLAVAAVLAGLALLEAARRPGQGGANEVGDDRLGAGDRSARTGSTIASRGLLLLTLGAALGGDLRAEGNRLWLGRLELVGPVDEVLLDCGDDGRTLVRAGLVAGERREVTVPVPFAPPLGRAGLAGYPVPTTSFTPSGEGSVRWLGPAEAQPEESWERLSAGLRARARPSFSPAGRGAPLGALLLVLGAQLAALGLWRMGGAPSRARAWGRGAAAGLLILAAAAALAWTRSSEPSEREEVLDHEVGRTEGVRFLAGVGSFELDPGRAPLRVEVEPVGGAMAFEVGLDPSSWRAEVSGGWVLAEPLEAGAPVDLAPAWWRDAAGAWTRFASVGDGQARAEAGEAAPGWLVFGLPPGRSLLVGRTGEGSWTRVVGAADPRR